MVGSSNGFHLVYLEREKTHLRYEIRETQLRMYNVYRGN